MMQLYQPRWKEDTELEKKRSRRKGRDNVNTVERVLRKPLLQDLGNDIRRLFLQKFGQKRADELLRTFQEYDVTDLSQLKKVTYDNLKDMGFQKTDRDDIKTQLPEYICEKGEGITLLSCHHFSNDNGSIGFRRTLAMVIISDTKDKGNSRTTMGFKISPYLVISDCAFWLECLNADNSEATEEDCKAEDLTEEDSNKRFRVQYNFGEPRYSSWCKPDVFQFSNEQLGYCITAVYPYVGQDGHPAFTDSFISLRFRPSRDIWEQRTNDPENSSGIKRDITYFYEGDDANPPGFYEQPMLITANDKGSLSCYGDECVPSGSPLFTTEFHLIGIYVCKDNDTDHVVPAFQVIKQLLQVLDWALDEYAECKSQMSLLQCILVGHALSLRESELIKDTLRDRLVELPPLQTFISDALQMQNEPLSLFGARRPGQIYQLQDNLLSLFENPLQELKDQTLDSGNLSKDSLQLSAAKNSTSPDSASKDSSLPNSTPVTCRLFDPSDMARYRECIFSLDKRIIAIGWPLRSDQYSITITMNDTKPQKSAQDEEDEKAILEEVTKLLGEKYIVNFRWQELRFRHDSYYWPRTFKSSQITQEIFSHVCSNVRDSKTENADMKTNASADSKVQTDGSCIDVGGTLSMFVQLPDTTSDRFFVSNFHTAICFDNNILNDEEKRTCFDSKNLRSSRVQLVTKELQESAQVALDCEISSRILAAKLPGLQISLIESSNGFFPAYSWASVFPTGINKFNVLNLDKTQCWTAHKGFYGANAKGCFMDILLSKNQSNHTKYQGDLLFTGTIDEFEQARSCVRSSSAYYLRSRRPYIVEVKLNSNPTTDARIRDTNGVPVYSYNSVVETEVLKLPMESGDCGSVLVAAYQSSNGVQLVPLGIHFMSGSKGGSGKPSCYAMSMSAVLDYVSEGKPHVTFSLYHPLAKHLSLSKTQLKL